MDENDVFICIVISFLSSQTVFSSLCPLQPITSRLQRHMVKAETSGQMSYEDSECAHLHISVCSSTCMNMCINMHVETEDSCCYCSLSNDPQNSSRWPVNVCLPPQSKHGQDGHTCRCASRVCLWQAWLIDHRTHSQWLWNPPQNFSQHIVPGTHPL